MHRELWKHFNMHDNSDDDNYSASAAASADIDTVHQQCIDFLSATFLHSAFSNVSWEDAKSYWLHLFGFSSVHYDSDDEDAVHQQCIDF